MNINNLVYGLDLILTLNHENGVKLFSHSSRPIRVEISVTSVCNYHCYFCKTHSYLKPQVGTFDAMPHRMLFELMHDLKIMGVKQLLFAGTGEPLLHTSLIDIISEFGNDFGIELMTNGSNLHEVDHKLMDKLDRLTVSINSGNGESHRAIHGYKSDNQFMKIYNNLERLSDFASKKIKLNYVVTKDNQEELPDFYEMAKVFGMATAVRPMSVDFPEIEDKAIKTSEKLNGLYPCYNSYIQPYVECNGDVLLCCEGYAKPLGNLNNSNFCHIWQDSLSVRREAIAMKSPMFPECVGCENVLVHSQLFHKIYSRLPFSNLFL